MQAMGCYQGKTLERRGSDEEEDASVQRKLEEGGATPAWHPAHLKFNSPVDVTTFERVLHPLFWN